MKRLFAAPRRPQIRARAYELWEQSGCPSGRDWDFWLQAERTIVDKFSRDDDTR
ncbi:DUF2934 domain-containing protein [Bradyrhizobium sp. USDA 4471]